MKFQEKFDELLKDTTYMVLKSLEGIVEEKSGENIALKLGVTRTAVWKSVEKLRSIGYNIEAQSRSGYKLVSSPELTIYSIIDISRKTGFDKFIDEVFYFDEVDSTNLIAKQEMRPGVLVVAGKQNKGRGRLGRGWISEEGGIYFSFNLLPGINLEELPKITLTTGVGVCRALEFVNTKLKWPNDIMVDGKKVSGILCELGGEADSVLVTVGIGINVNNEVGLDTSTSLRNLGVELKRDRVLEYVLENLAKYYEILFSGKKGWEKIRSEWKELSETLGNRVTIKLKNQSYSGKAEDIDKDGALLLRLEDGSVERIISGECFYEN